MAWVRSLTTSITGGRPKMREARGSFTWTWGKLVGGLARSSNATMAKRLHPPHQNSCQARKRPAGYSKTRTQGRYIYTPTSTSRDVETVMSHITYSQRHSGSPRTGYRWGRCRLRPSSRSAPTGASCVSSRADSPAPSSALRGNPGRREASATMQCSAVQCS